MQFLIGNLSSNHGSVIIINLRIQIKNNHSKICLRLQQRHRMTNELHKYKILTETLKQNRKVSRTDLEQLYLKTANLPKNDNEKYVKSGI